MSKRKLSEQLRRDAKTAEKITELYPADWDMDAVFRKSWQKYREAEAEQNDRPITVSADFTQHRKNIRFQPNRWVAAACLLLTVGIAGAVGYMQMRMPKLQTPEPDSDLSSALIEEVQPVTTERIETTAQNAQSQQTKASTSKTKAAEPQQTAPTPSGDDTEAEQQPVQSTTQTTVQTTVGTTVHTTQQTTVTTTAESVQGANTSANEGVAPPSVTDSDPEIPPEPQITTTSTTAQSKYTVLETLYGPGYTYERLENPEYAYKEYYIRFTREDQTYHPEPTAFSVLLDGYDITCERPTESSRKNWIQNPTTGFFATLTFSGGFYSWRVVHSSYSAQAITLQIGGTTVPAYFLSRDKDEELIWFDGMYSICMHVNKGYTAEMLSVAQALQTH